MTALYTGLYMPFGFGKGIERDDARADFARLHEIWTSNNPFLLKKTLKKTPNPKKKGEELKKKNL